MSGHILKFTSVRKPLWFFRPQFARKTFAMRKSVRINDKNIAMIVLHKRADYYLFVAVVFNAKYHKKTETTQKCISSSFYNTSKMGCVYGSCVKSTATLKASVKCNSISASFRKFHKGSVAFLQMPNYLIWFRKLPNPAAKIKSVLVKSKFFLSITFNSKLKHE